MPKIKKEGFATNCHKCKTCIHRTELFGNWGLACYYIVNVGHSRPCPAGEDCTVYQRGPRIDQRKAVRVRRKDRHHERENY